HHVDGHDLEAGSAWDEISLVRLTNECKPQRHGDTEKTDDGSTGVAKRRTLAGRIANTSASDAHGVRVRDPTGQRQSACYAGRPVEPAVSVFISVSLCLCVSVVIFISALSVSTANRKSQIGTDGLEFIARPCRRTSAHRPRRRAA